VSRSIFSLNISKHTVDNIAKSTVLLSLLSLLDLLFKLTVENKSVFSLTHSL
jgi:hypothetical protein